MKPNPAARARARKFLVQALYQAQMTGDDYRAVIEPFIEDHNMKRADVTYFREILAGIDQTKTLLEERILPKLDRPYDEIDPIEKGILLLGCYELTERIDIPFRVVINESVELAKSFGATDGHKYVNSVLDALAKEVRTLET